MSKTSLAASEIEASLRVERDAAERDIARYRLWFFVVILATSPIPAIAAHFGGRPGPPIGAVLGLYGTCIAYALALRAFVDRRGADGRAIYVGLVLDLCAISAPGFLFPLVAPAARSEMASFGPYLGPAGVLFVLFVNVLRMNGRASLFGAVVSVPVLWSVIVPLQGIKPPLVMVSVALVFSGVIGLAAARRFRHTLDTFARLQLLRRFLPATAVDRVLREDADSALALGGRSETVTLIAADLRGFTTMSEKLAPEEVVAQLNEFHGAMVDAIDRHDGVLDKFLGDGLLAVFGVTATGRSTNDAGAGSAVACARAMLAALDELNHTRRARSLPPLAIGIGVHTGAVVAGNIGAPGKRLEFTVIGDAVNSCSRLEGMTKETGRRLLVSHATVERLPSSDGLERLPPLTLRGRAEPFIAYGAS